MAAKAYGWKESIDGATPVAHVVTEDDARQALDAADLLNDATVRANAVGDVLGRLAQLEASNEKVLTMALTMARPPQSIVPGIASAGQLIPMPDESVLSLGPNGEVYLDAVRIVGGLTAVPFFARKLTQVGKSIYAQGKTVPTWWKWTGGGWVALTDIDVSLLN